MQHWKQLGLPLGLGLIAAVLNWYCVSSKVQPSAYVGVNQHVNPGDEISEAMLLRLEINGDHGLERAALPWEQRSILFGWIATRRMQNGSIVLRRDVTADRADVGLDEHEFTLSIGKLDAPADLYEDGYVTFALGNSDISQHMQTPETSFEVKDKDSGFVGPFRVIAISYQPSSKLSAAGTPQVERLTLVVPKTTEGRERMKRLLRAFQQTRGEQVLAIVRDSNQEELARDAAVTEQPSTVFTKEG